METPKWTCSQCTYDNVDFDQNCHMCNYPNDKGNCANVYSSMNPKLPKTSHTKRSTNPIVIDLSDSGWNSYSSMESARTKKRNRIENEKQHGLPPTTSAKDHVFGAIETSNRKITNSDDTLMGPSKNSRISDAEYCNTQKNVRIQKSKAKTKTKTKQTTLFDKNWKTIPPTKDCNTTSTTYFGNKNKLLLTSSTSTHINDTNRNNTRKREYSYDDLFKKSQQIMKSKFEIASLRSLQPQAIGNALKGQSQIIVMATGGGKSLCYLLPAATLPGIAIVITPLIALMIDQVENVNKKGIPAAFIASCQTSTEKSKIMKQLISMTKSTSSSSTSIKVLYCTPELLETSHFRKLLLDLNKRKQLSLFAIDEAHCLSTWGHDFRPAYRKLSWLRNTFPEVSCMACTATATPKVIHDIRGCLGFGEHIPCLKGSFNRKNIHYQVRYKDVLDSKAPKGSINDMMKIINQQLNRATSKGKMCSGIIYAHKREDTEMLTKVIKSFKIKVAFYHGGLSDKERAETQQKWTDGSIDVVVATVAFGMGIDKSNVRFVIHWNMPKSIEGFYQESGRAGRDGASSLSVLYYTKEDARKYSFLIKKNAESKRKKLKTEGHGVGKNAENENQSLAALESMVRYCENPICRRQTLLAYFGEKVNARILCNKTCDYCLEPSQVESQIQLSQVVKDINRPLVNGTGKYSKKNLETWDGQWDGPYDDNFDGSENFEKLRSISDQEYDGPLLEESLDSNSKRNFGGFQKASTVFAKYEAIECQNGKQSGFVKFKTKRQNKSELLSKLSGDCNDDNNKNSKTVKPCTISIPDHLRQNLPDPLQRFTKSNKIACIMTPEQKQSSTEISSEIDFLKKELAKIQKKKESRLRNVNASRD